MLRDKRLIDLIASIPKAEDRAMLVMHLDPRCVHNLCKHLKRFVDGKKGYSIDKKDGGYLTKVLTPHSRDIHRLLNKSGRQKNSFSLRKQKGGAIISTLLAVVAPIIASLIGRAVAKK